MTWGSKWTNERQWSGCPSTCQVSSLWTVRGSPFSISPTDSPPPPSLFVDWLDLHYASFSKILSMGLWKRSSRPRSFFRAQCKVSRCGEGVCPSIDGAPPRCQVQVTVQGAPSMCPLILRDDDDDDDDDGKPLHGSYPVPDSVLISPHIFDHLNPHHKLCEVRTITVFILKVTIWTIKSNIQTNQHVPEVPGLISIPHKPHRTVILSCGGESWGATRLRKTVHSSRVSQYHTWESNSV